MDENNWFFLAGIDNARFKRIVKPGDQLHLAAVIDRVKHDVWKFNTKATVEGQLVCAADLLLVKGALK